MKSLTTHVKTAGDPLQEAIAKLPKDVAVTLTDFPDYRRSTTVSCARTLESPSSRSSAAVMNVGAVSRGMEA